MNSTLRYFSGLLLALLVTFAPAAGVRAQDQPGTVKYPPQLDTQDSLVRIANQSRSTLTGAHDATVTTITVGSTATFPASGAAVVDSEIFFYTGKTATEFIGVTRGADGSTAATHLSGAAVRSVVAAVHHNTLADAIMKLQAKLGTGTSTAGASGLCLVSTGVGTTAWTACPGGSGGGSASAEELAHFADLNLALEPGAIELPIKRGLYNYVVGPNEKKLALSVWHSALGDCAGRFEVRNPLHHLWLRGVTLCGIYNPGPTPLQGSHAVIADPAKVSYSDPKGTYYTRRGLLDGGLRTTSVGITYSGSNTTFATDTLALTGTYGAVLTQTTNYDTPYVIIVTGAGQWLNMGDEDGDLADPAGTSAGNGVSRWGHRVNMPLTGYMMSAARIGPGDPETPSVLPKGSVTYVNLPPSWGKVVDSRVWLFRDDSWGVGSASADVDATKWQILDSTPSATTTGVSIHPQFKWHEIKGGGVAYGLDGLRSLTTFTRAAGLTFDFDVSLTDNSRCAIGWTNATGSAVSDWQHAYVIDTSVGQFQATVYENGVARVATGAGSITSKRIQHFQISLNADGSAVYRVQSQGYVDGSGNLAEPGGSFWHTYTVPGSAGGASSLKLTATCFDGTGYVRDLKVSSAPQ